MPRYDRSRYYPTGRPQRAPQRTTARHSAPPEPAPTSQPAPGWRYWLAPPTPRPGPSGPTGPDQPGPASAAVRIDRDGPPPGPLALWRAPPDAPELARRLSTGDTLQLLRTTARAVLALAPTLPAEERAAAERAIDGACARGAPGAALSRACRVIAEHDCPPTVSPEARSALLLRLAAGWLREADRIAARLSGSLFRDTNPHL